MIILDNTMLQAFNTCPRRFYWRHVRHLTPGDGIAPALNLGKAIHTALEKLYLGGTESEVLTAFLDDFDKSAIDEKRTPELGLLVIEAYIKKWFPEKWKVTSVEVSASIELAEDVMFCGRIDLIVEYMGGSYIVEHKTSSNFRWFIEKPNHQISGYLYIAKVLGHNVDGAIINLLGIFKTKRDFHRVVTARKEDELNDWRGHILSAKAGIDSCLEKGWFPMFTNSCWNCSYKDLCNSSPETLELVVESGYQIEKWEPWKDDKKGGLTK